MRLSPVSGNQIQPGTITPQQTLAVTSFETGASGSTNVTATVNSVANLQVGQQIAIGSAVGTLDSITAGQINGTQTITSINAATNTFTFSTGVGSASFGNQSSTEGGAGDGHQ